MKRTIALSIFLLATMHTSAQPQRLDGKTLWRHVEVLADDNMEGRGTGTPGLERAEAYVIDQLKKAGIAPAGTNGYLQPVRFVRREIVEKDCSVAVVRDGKSEPLMLPEDASFTTVLDGVRMVEAPLVFLGYGLNVPEKNYDDFGGLDLKGKVGVTLAGTPQGLGGPVGAHYLDLARRFKQFRAAGLVGWIIIADPTVPWASVSEGAAETTIELSGDEFNHTKGLQLSMWLNPKVADKIFDGSGHTPAELFALAKEQKPLPRFSLPVRVRATTRISNQLISSANVVGKLDGSDPQLRNEYVVLSAHIDHLGIGKPVDGDRIYNGAIDNASGVAALLDIAARLTGDRLRPKRSVLFAFFTGEELGMLGSKYFTLHPTVNRKSITADLNIDGIQAIVPLKAMLMLGAGESDLGDTARRITAARGVDMDVDLEPDANRFTCCSDQGSFAVAGIPALKLNVGFPGEFGAVQQKWRRERMHTPFDDTQQPVNLETVAKFEEIAQALLLDVANQAKRPEWKLESFYRRYAK